MSRAEQYQKVQEAIDNDPEEQAILDVENSYADSLARDYRLSEKGREPTKEEYADAKRRLQGYLDGLND